MGTNGFIQSVFAESVGPFRSMQVKLGSGFNVIIGSNASGKTTILKSIAMCFGHDFNDYRLGSESSVATLVSYPNESFLIGVDKKSFQEGRKYRQSTLRKWGLPNEVKRLIQQEVVLGNTGNAFSNRSDFRFAPHAIGPNSSIEYATIAGMSREQTGPDKIDRMGRHFTREHRISVY